MIRPVTQAVAALLILLLWGIMAPEVEAKPQLCQSVGDHEVCILKMKRSAKHYWEYWAAVSVDGEVRPREVYNCRDRNRVDRYGILIPFSRDLAGDVVCRLYVPRQTYLDRLNPPPQLSSQDG
ncbi:hypothetical protein [Lyngbya confervoides]|uniref:Uncharacterized protein n=1 Tax=Lyngbya confervoides BDU141951 TaxID=1574623 RepID=A0ABD4T9G3_9CYAN|nr:hypothetical protein [Lyngbya confervoides]MCM1985084.1 hypothetical protein [Lyngbya confervoides BDU141951]